MAGVSDRDADRAGHPGVADPQRPDSRAGHGMTAGGATARAPARDRPGTDASAGRRATAASSGTDSSPPRPNRRAAICAAGWRKWRRASQFRPAYKAAARAG
jgi:hypothetical protein